MVYNKGMVIVWDYDINVLKKSKRGRLLLLERQINYGVYPGEDEKINLKEVRENWDKLQISPRRRKLLKLLIWGK